MSVIRLPADMAVLSTHFDRILADAHHHQLGETVTLAIADDEVVAIDFATHTISLNFVQAVPDIPVFEANTYRVCDQWGVPLSVAAAQQLVINNPQLVLCGLPTEYGLLDIWHHNGEARALHCERGGDDTAFRAMLMASLAVDYPLEDAVTLARGYARQYEINSTLGWPLKRDVFPRPLTANHPQVSALGWHSKEVAVAPFAKTDAAKLALYPVVDTAEWVTRLLALGVTTTQLRIKDPHAPDLEQQIQAIIAAGEDHQAQVFVNDYWQLAIAHQAYGVHLGQEDLETADLAQIQQAGLRLGLSTHGYYEILRAAEFSPSYIALGHIYPTTTKAMPSKPQGLSRLALYQQLIGKDFPTVAIGGIDLSRAQAVWQTGVSSVAVVRAVTQAPDTQAALTAFNQILVR